MNYCGYDDDYNDDYGAYGTIDLLYEYKKHIDSSQFVSEICTEKDFISVLSETGLIQNKQPRIVCSMEELVFIQGNQNEVYSSEEIQFTERIEEVLVFPDFYKKMKNGNMPCRVVATQIYGRESDALQLCFLFEKIINKALEGFNIFFFVTEDSIYFGHKLFDKTGTRDCAISMPIKTEIEFSQFKDELLFYIDEEDFIKFYDGLKNTIINSSFVRYNHESAFMKCCGIQESYLEKIDELEKETGFNVSLEKERYWNQFEEKHEVSFAEMLDDIENDLSYVKSNKVNTYEMLFEAEEMIKRAEEKENDNLRREEQTEFEHLILENSYNLESDTMLDDPEELIKILKKQRGI